MIERIDAGVRSSKIVKHNGVAYLTGQVCEGDPIQEHVTIWLADMSDFAGLNEVWNDWVPEGHAPARACGEAKLARDVLRVEFIVDAAYD